MVPGKLAVLLKMRPAALRDPQYMGRIAGEIYGGRLRRSPELASEHLRHVRWSSDYGYPQLLAAVGWSSLPWLALLKQPALVMSGADDPLVPAANAQILARLIPDAVSLDRRRSPVPRDERSRIGALRGGFLG